MNDDIPVKAVRTTFDIVQALSKEGTMRFSDLVDRLDRPKSTVHDHLQSLESLGYVRETEEGYQVSLEFLLIGDRRRSTSELFRTARSELDELAATTGEHVSLLGVENGVGRAIYTVQGDDAVDFKVYDGTPSHLGETAPGKTILANLPESTVADILDEHGLPDGVPAADRSAFLDELAEIREREFAIDEQQAIPGMSGVGVPIVDRDGVVRGAISVYGPDGRMETERLRGDLAEQLQQKANIIELNIDLAN